MLCCEEILAGRRGSQVVRQRSAKPLFGGSIPPRASNNLQKINDLPPGTLADGNGCQWANRSRSAPLVGQKTGHEVVLCPTSAHPAASPSDAAPASKGSCSAASSIASYFSPRIVDGGVWHDDKFTYISSHYRSSRAGTIDAALTVGLCDEVLDFTVAHGHGLWPGNCFGGVSVGQAPRCQKSEPPLVCFDRKSERKSRFRHSRIDFDAAAAIVCFDISKLIRACFDTQEGRGTSLTGAIGLARRLRTT